MRRWLKRKQTWWGWKFRNQWPLVRRSTAVKWRLDGYNSAAKTAAKERAHLEDAFGRLARRVAIIELTRWQSLGDRYELRIALPSQLFWKSMPGEQRAIAKAIACRVEAEIGSSRFVEPARIGPEWDHLA